MTYSNLGPWEDDGLPDPCDMEARLRDWLRSHDDRTEAVESGPPLTHQRGGDGEHEA